MSDSEFVANLIKSWKLLKGHPGHSYVIFLVHTLTHLQTSAPSLLRIPEENPKLTGTFADFFFHLCRFMVSNLSWPFNLPQQSLILFASQIKCFATLFLKLSACNLTSCSTHKSKSHKSQYFLPPHWRLLTTWVTLRTSESIRHAQTTASFWECGHFQI